MEKLKGPAKRNSPLSSGHAILAADIGGTNANFALVKPAEGSSPSSIVHKARYDTQSVKDFPGLVNRYLEEAATAGFPKPRDACFAIAGPVQDNRGKLTHAEFPVDAREILEKTPLKRCMVINDFDAVSFSIPSIGKKDLKVVRPGKAIDLQPIVVIGAGTGLGKSLLVWEEHRGAYVPVPSETGHADLVIQTQEELEFVEFTRKRFTFRAPASWAMILSGQGLVNVYLFLRATSHKAVKECPEIATQMAAQAGNPSPELISAHRKTDPICKEAFRWFERFYARLAKNAVLDHVAGGGVYIAGGIVAHNPDMFTPAFNEEFTDVLLLKHILEPVPVWAVLNYDVSLLGCANAMVVWNEKVRSR